MLYVTTAGKNFEGSELASCSGRLDNGWRKCADGCIGHWERYSGDGDFGSANEVLYWVPNLPASEMVGEWSSQAHGCMSDERSIRLVGHPALFRSGPGEIVPVWVLAVDDHQGDERSDALAFTDLAKAQTAFNAEVEAAEDGCDC